jgi:hypothetical protein
MDHRGPLVIKNMLMRPPLVSNPLSWSVTPYSPLRADETARGQPLLRLRGKFPSNQASVG